MVDIQVMVELATLSALAIQVTVLLSLASLFPLFSIVKGTFMSPHTFSAEHVYVTLSLAAAEVLSTLQVGVSATETNIVKINVKKQRILSSVYISRDYGP